MKTIFRIARLELSTLFYSPVAWLVLIVFAFQSGLQFVDTIHDTVAQVRVNAMIAGGITGRIVFMFAEVQQNLYLYIPLLTMGLMSREFSSGSVRLLYSSPVTVTEIVLGKFLAMLIYGLMLVVILLVFVAASGLLIHAADLSRLCAAILGLYLLIAAYSALGLLMSCLTAYQVVAAISTLVVLAGLNFIGTIWQNVDLIRDVTYYLSISGRGDQFIYGLVSSKNIFYFLIVTVFLLGLAIIFLTSARESKPLWLTTGKSLLLLIAAVTAGFITSRPSFTAYYDMTATQGMTLTPDVQRVLKELKEPLKIHTYVNVLDDNLEFGLPDVRNKDRAFFGDYQRFLSYPIEMDYVYYYDSSKNDWLYMENAGLPNKALAQKVAKARHMDFDTFLDSSRIRQLVDLRPEENRFVRQLEYKGKKTFVRMFADMLRVPSESEIAAGMKRLLVKAPVIAFVTGHHERSILNTEGRDYKNVTSQIIFRDDLVNQGFDVRECSLDTAGVSPDIDVLVLADPAAELKPQEMDRLQTYIGKGGNMVIAGEPGRQQLLNAVIEKLGVRFREGTMVQESRDFAPGLIVARLSGGAGKYTSGMKTLQDNKAKISMPGAVALEYSGKGPFTVDSVLVSNEEKAWVRMGVINTDSGKVVFDTARGDHHQPQALALSMARKINNKEQRIMVLGDADFMSNAERDRHNISTENSTFLQEMFKWLSYGAYPVSTDRPQSKDQKLRITRRGIPMLKLIFLGLIPGLVLFSGVVLLRRRMRK
jgi:ABC-2 type transport system permease protein